MKQTQPGFRTFCREIVEQSTVIKSNVNRELGPSQHGWNLVMILPGRHMRKYKHTVSINFGKKERMFLKCLTVVDRNQKLKTSKYLSSTERMFSSRCRRFIHFWRTPIDEAQLVTPERI